MSATLKPSLVIGSGGQVASALVDGLRARGVPFLSSSSSGKPGTVPLNLADAASIRAFFKEAEARWPGEELEVFLPGALTHVDRCEVEQDLCRAINEEGPALVAEACAAGGHRLTFFSTEYVFGEDEYHGGAVGPFSESDPPAPTSFYGKCKAEAEQRILGTLGEEGALIVRTTMVFSYHPQKTNFLMQYLKQLEDVRSGKNPAVFKIPVDQISTPTYAPALAEDTLALRERGVGGIINLVGSDCLSRKEILFRVIDAFGFDRNASMSGFAFLKTAEIGQKAKRPLTAGLKADRARSLGLKVLSLDEMLSLALAAKKNF